MTDPLLKIEELRTWVGSGDRIVHAVDGLSFAIERGETFALLGESGCGKSLTALSIMRLLPDAGVIVGGRVLLDGVDLIGLPERRMRDVRGRRIAMIFQEPGASLNPVMTVGDQVREVLARHLGLTGAKADRRVLELFESVGIPDPARRLGEYPFQLSGGLKQRVMIAAALACEPELLVADEPTTALDVTIQAQVLELLRDLQRRTGMSILLITHDLGVVSEMAHRVAVMYAGEIVETAPRERFFGQPAHPYTRKLFASLPGPGARDGRLAVIRGTVPPLWTDFTGCRFADRCDRSWSRCREAEPTVHFPIPEHAVRCHLYADGAADEASTVSAGGKPAMISDHGASGFAKVHHRLLEIEDLRIHFPIRRGLFKRIVGHVKAVDGISLSIPAGRTVALVGESGCGKTTAGKGIVRLLPSVAGSIRFGGVDLARLGQSQLRGRRRDFQIIFQDPFASLNPRMRVCDIIEEGMTALGVGDTAVERLTRVEALLEQVGLSPDMSIRYPHEFSGGQRQRIAIARALAVDPKLIVCDEPTSALDVSVQAQILNLLRDLQDRLGIAYLFITHNIAVVEYIAHEVAVMYLGRIVEHGTVDEVLRSPRHPYTKALLSAVPTIERTSAREVIRLTGDIPSPANPPPGCHFEPRCPNAMPECRAAYPAETRLSSSHWVRCLLYEQQ
ncbi:MAG: ABC transporter ATP-binding protein [Betaproteobacteria bacterium]